MSGGRAGLSRLALLLSIRFLCNASVSLAGVQRVCSVCFDASRHQVLFITPAMSFLRLIASLSSMSLRAFGVLMFNTVSAQVLCVGEARSIDPHSSVRLSLLLLAPTVMSFAFAFVSRYDDYVSSEATNYSLDGENTLCAFFKSFLMLYETDELLAQ